MARAKLVTLRATGVGTLIDLTFEVRDGLRDYEALLRSMQGGRHVQRLRAPIQDLDIAAESQVHRILDLIDSSLQQGAGVYVHGWGGIGRTGMIAGCLLVRRGMDAESVLRVVADGWQSMPKSRLPRHIGRTSPETLAQMDVVRKWADREATHRRRRTESDCVVELVANDTSRDTPERADLRRRVRGCLIGGAMGDALGYPVEFMSWAQIQKQYRPAGVRELAIDLHLGAALISDDTQMTLFTAEGMLRGINRGNHRGGGGPSSCMRQSYLRWLVTQGERVTPAHDEAELMPLVLGWAAEQGPLHSTEPADLEDFDGRHPGWLVRVKRLHARRAPGTTCLASLRMGGIRDNKVWANDRKGNGGVMRVAPVGLFPQAGEDTVFELGCEAAGITHGHPTGRLTAGVFAFMILKLVYGVTIRDAVLVALERVRREREHEETSVALAAALALFDSGVRPTPAVAALMGNGRVAEEALAIEVCCALHDELA